MTIRIVTSTEAQNQFDKLIEAALLRPQTGYYKDTIKEKAL